MKSVWGPSLPPPLSWGRALEPVQQGIGAWKQTFGAKAAFKRLNRLLKRARGKTPIGVSEEIHADLKVQNLSLALGERAIIKDLSFALKAGESMGLIGHNGSGKTSLCRMLLGIWEPDSGTIRLGGHEVARLHPQCLGHVVGYLPQDVELFTGTVSENIARMGEMDSQKVIKAATMAGAHGTILDSAEGMKPISVMPD